MPIRVVCAECGSKLDIREELAGVKRKCPKCKTEFTVPTPEDDSEGVELAADDEPPALAAPAEEPSDEIAVPAAARSAPALDASNDDDDEDYIPSFVTEEKPKAKTPVAKKPAPKDEDDDEPVLSIPNLPPPTKPKFKPFDPDEFADDEPEEPRRSSKSTPVPSAKERTSKSRIPDEFDDEPPSRSRPSRNTPRDFDEPSSSLSDSSIPATSATRDRAQAARELRQALKESTLKAPPEERGPRGGFNFDLSVLWSEIGLKGLGLFAGLLLVLPLAYYAGDQMTGGGWKLPKLAQVSGTVTYNGTPSPGAIVYMAPIEEQVQTEGKKKFQIRTSFGVADDKGHFKMMYVEKIPGVAVGKCRVWVQPATPMFLAGDFTQASITVRDIAAGSQTLDIPLTGPQKK